MVTPYYRFIHLCLFLLVCACSNDDENIKDTPADPVGPIPGDEFAAAPVPTYQEVLTAYESVTADDPSLLEDEAKLARAMFDWVDDHANGRLAQGQETGSYFNLTTRLTLEEWKVVMTNPIDAYNVISTVAPSLEAAETEYPCDSDVSFRDGKADAVRHAYWNILMAFSADEAFAEAFSTAHESAATEPNASKMDLHNNKFGLALKARYPDATPEQLLILLTQQKFFFLEDPNAAIPEEANDALVYFRGKRLYDGEMSGIITNPDSGGPWDITISFNQCGDHVRGQYTIVRGEAIQKRRFSGAVDENNTLTLDVSAPYVFENPNGMPYCANMTMRLTGTTATLEGNWTSSNCYLGGVLDLSK
ncbi:DUF6973 domain-containing protein [Dawidia soli]|uniref:DUF6973 domain-containing protein n=1 Tax=Dawidia soli TaxID=2782352 RepID=A0AAP2DF33_9BACT|nr:hypothetical protein [Dawidia soli]MBT1690673.1 hypothetical protein [Dawidia soli]